MRARYVPFLGVLALLLAGRAAGDEKPARKFLTKDGQLTQELEIHEIQGGGLAVKSRRWTVKPNGQWELAVRDVGVTEASGTLTKEQLAKLAAALEKYGLDTLRSLNPRGAPADAKSYEVRYGNRQVSTVSPLPKPGTQTLKGRYAGILDAVERLLKVQK